MTNQKGYSLVIVLLTITILFIFGLSLSSMVINNRVQINKTEKITEATDIAEMGITYYDTVINEIVTSANIIAKSKTEDYIEDLLEQDKKGKGKWKGKGKKNRLPLEPVDKADINKKYTYEFCNTLLDKNEFILGYSKNLKIQTNISKIKYISLTGSCSSSDELKLVFTSEGNIIKGSKFIESKLLKGYITIKKIQQDLDQDTGNDDGTPKLDPFQYKNKLSDPINCKSNYGCSNLAYDSSVYFYKNISINKGNKHLVIKGDVFFADGLELQGSSTLTVTGNVVIKNGFINTGMAYKICATGKVYLLNSNGTLTELILPEKNSCRPTGTDNPNINIHWSSDAVPIDVRY